VGQLRIIGGQWRGRHIHAPAGRTTRPLPDRVRQSLFDYLGQTLDGWQVADCCAGSGAFGLEAASRGASAVHLAETDRDAQTCIAENIGHLQAAACVLHREAAAEMLVGLRPLHCVFADPPFPWYRDEPQRLRELIEAAAPSLAPDGLLLVRGERGVALPPHAAPLHQRDLRSYGRSWVAVFQPRA